MENKGVYHTALSQSHTHFMLGSPERPFSRKIPFKTFSPPLFLFLREGVLRPMTEKESLVSPLQIVVLIAWAKAGRRDL